MEKFAVPGVDSVGNVHCEKASYTGGVERLNSRNDFSRAAVLGVAAAQSLDRQTNRPAVHEKQASPLLRTRRQRLLAFG
jgi:hypothetical protein